MGSLRNLFGGRERPNAIPDGNPSTLDGDDILSRELDRFSTTFKKEFTNRARHGRSLLWQVFPTEKRNRPDQLNQLLVSVLGALPQSDSYIGRKFPVGSYIEKVKPEDSFPFPAGSRTLTEECYIPFPVEQLNLYGHQYAPVLVISLERERFNTPTDRTPLGIYALGESATKTLDSLERNVLPKALMKNLKVDIYMGEPTYFDHDYDEEKDSSRPGLNGSEPIYFRGEIQSHLQLIFRAVAHSQQGNIAPQE